jgi:hypothetical protein
MRSRDIHTLLGSLDVRRAGPQRENMGIPLLMASLWLWEWVGGRKLLPAEGYLVESIVRTRSSSPKWVGDGERP